MPFLKQLTSSPAVLMVLSALIGVYVAVLVNPAVAEQLSLPADPAAVADRPWSPLTVMFVHENPVHLVVMLVMLAAFGTVLAQSAPSWEVAGVYLTAGLVGSLAVLAVAALVTTDGGMVGASAAVLGVAGAVLARRPSARIFGGTGMQWLAALVGINIVFLFTQPLGAVAHLAGMAVGVGYGRWLRARELPDGEEPQQA